MVNIFITNKIILEIDIWNQDRFFHIIPIPYVKYESFILYSRIIYIVVILAFILNSFCSCLVKNSFYMKEILK